MASHSFIVSWMLSPKKKGAVLGTEWSVGFRGQEYQNTHKYSEVMHVTFSFSGGNVGITPSSSSSLWDSAFPGSDKLAFCGYYWWNNSWFGGFIDWWPINEGNRTSRDLKNADGQFETAWNSGIKKFCFVITDMHGKRTNFGVIER